MARREQRDNRPVEATISAAETYRLGDPVDVTFEVRNTGTEPIQLLTWDTPLDGEVRDFLAVEREGRPLPYDGPMFKRGEPTDDNYVVVAAGQTLSRTVDISRAYSIDQPGVYRASLKASFQDAFNVTGAAKRPPRLRSQHEPRELEPVIVQFTVVPGAAAKHTDGQAARAKEAGQPPPQAKGLAKAKAPSFNGGTSQQQADTVVAHDNAQYFAALANLQLTTTTGSSNALYDDWFGTFDQGRYDTVAGHYADISGVLLGEQVTYDFNGSECDASTFAYTYKGTRTIYLCALYLSAAQIGTDCKFGTLVHEWSHAVSSTDDYVYGESGAGNLANTDPGKAIDNADNHEYFAEHLAQSDFGKSLTFVTDRSTFGKDEVDALLVAGSPAVIEAAFYVHADGFWPAKLGITASTLGASPSVKPTLTVNPTITGLTVEVASLQAEDPALPVAPQRFTWVCRVKFTSSSGFPSQASGEQLVTLSASLAALAASAQIRLIHEASPYELDGPVSWLSTDARVFQIRAGESRFGATIGSTPAAASTFMKQVIANLNAGSSGGQTFDSISTDQQTSQLELARQVGGTNVFNFVVAKVRYRGTLGVSNVRVFFRLFPVSTTSTEFDLSTTYRRGTQGSTVIPKLGLSGSGDLVSIPCFAEPRVDSAVTALSGQTDPANVRSLAATSGTAESVAYFGAWLDINQTDPQFPANPSPGDGPWSSGRKSIQELVRNAHQCLVAEIAYDGDPIQTGATPGGSDKLAQRNLSIVESANPGDVASHRIANVFEVRPTPVTDHKLSGPDELLIDWGNVPTGTTATVYIPEVDAAQIIALAGTGVRRSGIRQVDGQTISVPTGGISYVPLPAGATFGLTGLLTLDLPPTVKKGESYHVAVRQVTDAFPMVIEQPPEVVIRKTPTGRAGARAGQLVVSAVAVPPRRWRRVVGSYQITIPVRTEEAILPRETRLLSVLRWILASIPTGDRWYPTFSRYVGIVGDRVGALGGDPEEVVGSPDGSGVRDGGRPGQDGGGTGTRVEVRERHVDGKVTGVIYDCFGDFEGFLLDDCGRELRFEAREHEIERLVTCAWRERIAVTVVVRVENPRRPVSIILRRAPEPFQG